MKHSEKVKMARKMLTPAEQKKRGKKVGFILFESEEWKKRRAAIEERVRRKQSKKKL